MAKTPQKKRPTARLKGTTRTAPTYRCLAGSILNLVEEGGPSENDAYIPPQYKQPKPEDTAYRIMLRKNLPAIMAFLDHKPVQVRNVADGTWSDVDMGEVALSFWHYEYRQKPVPQEAWFPMFKDRVMRESFLYKSQAACELAWSAHREFLRAVRFVADDTGPSEESKDGKQPRTVLFSRHVPHDVWHPELKNGQVMYFYHFDSREACEQTWSMNREFLRAVRFVRVDPMDKDFVKRPLPIRERWYPQFTTGEIRFQYPHKTRHDCELAWGQDKDFLRAVQFVQDVNQNKGAKR